MCGDNEVTTMLMRMFVANGVARLGGEDINGELRLGRSGGTCGGTGQTTHVITAVSSFAAIYNSVESWWFP